ncbi:hypothetical protein FV139_02115 [Parahaliea maris]|uniref:Tetratricopeptide repeat protein n=1 Tax=Parahaliea maris TaxID=2716870 RepID=A0A5C9A8E6_9GAMM|nr:hypothetical protein [Parahaliea maris]TXS96314.1 hypothetical protein FV139_02115 [Parahaliea maris]
MKLLRFPSGSSITPIFLGYSFLLILTAFVYANGVSGPWLFDDHPNLLQNSLLRMDGSTFDNWRAATFSSGAGPLRRPIAMFSFAVNYVASGELNPVTVKATNTVIHLLTGLLVGLLAYLVCRTPALSWRRSGNGVVVGMLASMLWLLSPLHVSTVLYAIQRMAQLSALFVMTGLCIFLTYRLRWARDGASPGELLGAGLWLGLMYMLAVLSKENGALLPWLIVVLEVALFRGQWNGKFHISLHRTALAILILPLVSMIVVLAVWPQSILGGYQGRDFTFLERLLTQARLLWQYAYWTVVPDIGSMGLHHDDIPLSRSFFQPSTTAASLLGWLFVAIIAFLLRKRFPVLLFAVLFYLVAHSMESTVLPLEMVFEHRNYLPSVGICILLGCVVVVAADRLRLNVLLLGGALGMIAAVFLFIRVMTWSDEVRLAQVNMVNHPQSMRAQQTYSNVLLEHFLNEGGAGNEDERPYQLLSAARQNYQRSLQLDPGNLASLVMLYQVDTAYYPGLAAPEDRLLAIKRQLESSVLLPTDISALETLMRCLGGGSCRVDSDTVSEQLLGLLRSRFPGGERVYQLEYEYLTASNAPSEKRRALLREAIDANPSSGRLYLQLISELAREGRLGEVYELVAQYLQVDRPRRQLPAVMQLFKLPASEAG